MTQIPPTKHRIGYSVLELVFQNKNHSINLILYFCAYDNISLTARRLDTMAITSMPFLMAMCAYLYSSWLSTPNLHVRIKCYKLHILLRMLS